MSEVKDVRSALEKIKARREATCWTSEIESAIVSEGLAACDDHDAEQAKVTAGSTWVMDLHTALDQVAIIASILRKAGLL